VTDLETRLVSIGSKREAEMRQNAIDDIKETKGEETEAKEQQGQVVVIDINLSRGLVLLLSLALLTVAFLGYLTWDREEASAAGLLAPLAASSGMRQYYLTETSHSGGDADGTDGDGAGVCEPGYHFASVWEILDTSGLRYNTTFGKTRDDSGHGPPAGVPMAGWVRTGNYSSANDTPGEGNCNNWDDSSDENDYGTIAALPPNWNPTAQHIHVWNAGTEPCDSTIRVWCVED
jgi:hypothetical protein